MTITTSHGHRDTAGKSPPSTGDGLRVAVVGGGIAGLTTAYRLGQHHRVTLYETRPTPGMAFHGLIAGAGEGRVDVPLRVFSEGHYHELLALYQELGVVSDPVDHSSSYSSMASDETLGETYFRYGVGPEGSDAENAALTTAGMSIMQQHARFVALAAQHQRDGLARGLSLGEYLAAYADTPEYATRFVVPSFAGIATCSFQTAEAFPADVALELLLSGMLRVGLRRVRGGAAAAVERFAARLQDFRGSTHVTRVEQEAQRVVVTDSAGRSERFDHVVMATPANLTARMAALTRSEYEALTAVRYERVRVVVHRDPRQLPPVAQRSAFNFVVDEQARRTSSTIWVHALQPDVAPEVFQTINPIIEPDPAQVLSDLTLERAAVSAHNALAGERVGALNDDPARRIWLCGSYATRGVPLLESGVRSANRVAAAIDALGPASVRVSA